ncbi:MAG: hypothetical protein KC776_35710 [Myxococcales bacterium]|nr:hypothetical protein [Myxococcales bacterium]MCB9578582.1 hypothetical protein [Polyangiaceae bacterium]
MNATLVLVLVVIFSFAIGHLLTRYASRFVTLSGAEYILVGVLIGPHFPWKLLSAATVDRLAPLFSLLLGLVGFVLGLRGKREARRIDEGVAGFSSALLTLIAVSGAVLTALTLMFPADAAQADFVYNAVLLRTHGYLVEVHVASTHLWVALGVGAAAAVASPLLIESTRRLSAAGGRVSDLLEASARASQITAVLVSGVVLASARATDAASRYSMTVTEWVIASVAVGVVSGLLFGLFIGRESEPAKIFLATIGLVTFASGVGAALGISPLFVCLMAAVTVSLTSSHCAKVQGELDRLQHPLFVLVMIFAGTLWDPVRGWAWLFPALYVLVRFVGRRMATWLAVKLFLEDKLVTRRVGNGLLSQGTLAVAIGVNFAQRFPSFSSLILTTVLVGTLLSDLFSARALRALLADAGELGQEAPKVEESSEAPA